MAAPVRVVVRQVRPILSLNEEKARQRVLNLYKSWYRQVPYIIMDYNIPVTADDLKSKIREEFLRNKDVKDIRVIDLLVLKGQMELQETVQLWKNKGSFMFLLKDTVVRKPIDFMSKFLIGHE